MIVVDGESTDGTPSVVEGWMARHPNIRLYRNPKRLSSAARNVGVRRAAGDLIVFVDGHCEIENEHYLQNLVEAFRRSGADCLGRPQPLDVPGASRLQCAIAAARASWLGHHPASWIYASREGFVRPQSVAVAYRREVFEAVGLFDESFDACEDVEFNHRVERAGLRCFFTPAVRVRYYPRSSLRGLFRQLTRYGRGRIRLFRKHPGTFSVPCFVPMLILLAFAGTPLLAWAPPRLAGPYLGMLAFYGVLTLVISLQVARRRRDWAILPWLPLVFATIHFACGAGILQELLAGFARRRRPKTVPLPLEPTEDRSVRSAPLGAIPAIDS